MFKNLKVIYTTNLRGDLARTAQVSTLVQEARARHEPSIVLCGGNLSWGTDECNYFKGEPMWKALRGMNCDGITLGPDDFLHGWRNIVALVPGTAAPVTLCNLFTVAEDERVKALPPYRLFRKYEGMKVGILGAIDEKIEFENENTVKLDYADTSLLWAAKKLKEEKCDCIIAMCYMSLERCMEMAQNVAGLDLIICTDYAQQETTGMFNFSSCLISCENTKGTKVAVVDIDKL